MASRKKAAKKATKKTAKKAARKGQAEFTALVAQINALKVGGGATVEPVQSALAAFADRSGYIVASS